MALEVANRGYVLETGHVALADEAKALARNEQVRKTYLSETEPRATRYDFGTNCFVSDTRTCQAERALLDEQRLESPAVPVLCLTPGHVCTGHGRAGRGRASPSRRATGSTAG